MLIVVDLGNSRVKWGRCTEQGVAEMAALPLFDVAAFDQQRQAWAKGQPCRWKVASTNPLALDRFRAWLTLRDEPFTLLQSADQFGLKLDLEQPEACGKDRLANALAYRDLRLPRTGRPGMLVSAGSALTADLLDTDGTFRGGAILPGLAMMAAALNYYTTRLPRVDLPATLPSAPGRHTQEAIQLGIVSAGVGAVQRLRQAYAAVLRQEPVLVLTGGDASLLHAAFPDADIWPEQTLEGLRLAARQEP